MIEPDVPVESVEAFQLRARAWLAENMPRAVDTELSAVDIDIERWQRERRLQRKLYDGGFAGLCFPTAYGGQGLPYTYQQAFDQEAVDYDLPFYIDVPTLGIIGATILEFGTEEQKQRYLPAMLRGEEIWVQMLSEPTGGSDLASVMTRATRQDDVFVVSGSKIWTSGCYAADYGLCVTRTNWDVPKHDGITVLIVKLDQPGVTVERIVGVRGDREFCQEFFNEVRVPVGNVLGDVDAGWTVVRGLLAHERDSMGGSSRYVSSIKMPFRGPRTAAFEHAIAAGSTRDPRVRQLVAEAHVMGLVQQQTSERVARAMEKGQLSPHAGALLRLMGARHGVRRSDIALEIAGVSAASWQPGDSLAGAGQFFIGRQGAELGGGSTEMQRNIISERVLEMPREVAADRGVPFKEVRHNAMPMRRGR